MVIKCSKQTFLFSTALWLVLSLVGLGFTAFGFAQQEGLFIIMPDEIYILGLTLFGLWALVSVSGLVARVCQNQCALTNFILLGLVTIFVTMAAFTYIVLFVNDIETFGNLDDGAAEAQKVVEESLFQYAVANPAEWIEAQDGFQCCGYDLESSPPFVEFDITTGALCADFDFNALPPSCQQNGAGDAVFSENCEADVLAIVENQFFCKDAIKQFFKDQTPVIGAAFGGVVLLQLVAWFSGIRMFWVPYEDGGFFDGDESYDILPTSAKVGGYNDGLPTPNSGFNNGFQTNNFGRSVRSFGNRISARLQGGPFNFGGGGAAVGPGGPGGRDELGRFY